MQIILASASPRRKQILSEIVSDFLIIPSKAEEKADLSLPPEQIVMNLARQKGEEVFSSHPNDFVIASDTIVYFSGKVLGKPKNKADAVQTLKALSGKQHSVFTGLCFLFGKEVVCDFVESKVLFCELSDEFIDSYVDSGSPMDKAGSYGIQDGGLVKEYFGSYTNIIGFPKEKVKEYIDTLLRKNV